MKKLFSVLSCVIALLLSALVIAVVFWLSKGWIAFIILLVLFMLVGVLMMRSGIETVLSVKETVLRQIQNDSEISFDGRHLISAYLRIFFPIWLFFFLIPLAPGQSAWLLVSPPILLSAMIALKSTEHTWITVEWKRRTYWLVHLLAIGIMVCAGIAIRILIY